MVDLAGISTPVHSELQSQQVDTAPPEARFHGYGLLVGPFGPRQPPAGPVSVAQVKVANDSFRLLYHHLRIQGHLVPPDPAVRVGPHGKNQE
jgi:hypothetical protein